jgi:hypothetical protein
VVQKDYIESSHSSAHCTQRTAATAWSHAKKSTRVPQSCANSVCCSRLPVKRRSQANNQIDDGGVLDCSTSLAGTVFWFQKDSFIPVPSKDTKLNPVNRFCRTEKRASRGDGAACCAVHRDVIRQQRQAAIATSATRPSALPLPCRRAPCVVGRNEFAAEMGGHCVPGCDCGLARCGIDSCNIKGR